MWLAFVPFVEGGLIDIQRLFREQGVFHIARVYYL